MSDQDYGLAPPGAKPSDSTPGKHRGPRFTWNSQYEATFFRSLCESVNLGLREGSTFKPQAWDRAIQALIDKHNAYANKSHLINKSDNARKKYRLWIGLREDNSFYYNPQNRTVTGTEEAWARHLQVRRRHCDILIITALLTSMCCTERTISSLAQRSTFRTRRILRDPLP